MRRKKIRNVVISLVIVILIIIGIIFINNKNSKNVKRLNNLYEELNTSNMYSFEMKKNDTNKTIMAKKDDRNVIDQYTDKNHETTIIKDNNTYLVLHNREEYYVYEQNNIEQNILIEGLKEVVQKPFTTGTEKIKGKTYKYEEYKGTTIFSVSNSLEKGEEEIKTRFYFDKDDKLVYIKTINGVYQELLGIKIEKDISDSLFEIPKTYAEN